MSENDLREFFKKNWKLIFRQINADLNVDGYVQFVKIYNDLTKENPELIQREVLEEYIKQVIAGQQLLISNFHKILGRVVRNRCKGITDLRSVLSLIELGPVLRIVIPSDMHGFNAQNTILDFNENNIDIIIIILQGVDQAVIEFLENCRVKSRGIILLNFEKEKLESILNLDEEYDIKMKVSEFIDQMDSSHKSFFASRMPILEITKIPSEKQIDNLIDSLSTWIAEKMEDAPRTDREKQLEQNIKRNYEWGVKYAEHFGKAKIVDFQIPPKIKVGDISKTSARIEGSIKDGFIDLALIGPDGRPPYCWFPDPKSYDSSKDNGNLTFDRGYYDSQEWEFKAPDRIGKYKAIMGIFENVYAERVCVDYFVREIDVF